MPTKPGDRLPMDDRGQYHEVVEVFDANDYLLQKRLESPSYLRGSSNERCALFGAASSREKEFREHERKRLVKVKSCD